MVADRNAPKLGGSRALKPNAGGKRQAYERTAAPCRGQLGIDIEREPAALPQARYSSGGLNVTDGADRVTGP
jgi:hypothetical protein